MPNGDPSTKSPTTSSNAESPSPPSPPQTPTNPQQSDPAEHQTGNPSPATSEAAPSTDKEAELSKTRSELEEYIGQKAANKLRLDQLDGFLQDLRVVLLRCRVFKHDVKTEMTWLARQYGLLEYPDQTDSDRDEESDTDEGEGEGEGEGKPKRRKTEK